MNNPIKSTVLNSYNFNTTSNYVAFANNFVKTETTSVDKGIKYGFQGFYRWVPMFVIPNSDLTSFSFGFIFLEQEDVGDDQVLNHEWGHTRQMLLLGIGDYFNMIAMPSMITNLIARKHYVNYNCMPWEITADMFGGVNRPEHTDTAKGLGIAYLATSEFVSNTFVKPMMLPVYTTAAALLDGVIPGLGTTLLAIMYTS